MPGTKKKTMPRPRPREVEIAAQERRAAERGNRAAEREARDAESLMPTDRMAQGGMCRGMGAATKGGKFSRG